MKKKLLTLAVVISVIGVTMACGRNKEAPQTPTEDNSVVDEVAEDVTTNNLQDDLDTINSYLYEPYNDTEINGTDMRSAVKAFLEGKESPFAIFVMSSNVGGYAENDMMVTPDCYGNIPTDLRVTKEGDNWFVESLGTDTNTNWEQLFDKADSHYVDWGTTWHSNTVIDRSTGDVRGLLFRQK